MVDLAQRRPLVEDLLFCIGGSIAAAGVPYVLQRVLEQGIARRISVVLSEHAGDFVAEAALAVMTNRPCVTDIFSEAVKGRAIHVELSHRCSFAVVAPVTANLIGKLANGIVDCSVTTALSVFSGPIVLVPALHPVTFAKPSLQRNLSTLRCDGYLVYGPVEGYSVSEGARGFGPGAMPEPDSVAAFLELVASNLVSDGTSAARLRADKPEEV